MAGGRASLRLLGYLTSSRDIREHSPRGAYWRTTGARSGCATPLRDSYEQIAAREQGKRTPSELKRARALVVYRLRQRGATLEELGSWLSGRKSSSVLALERIGEAEQAKLDAARTARYLAFNPEEAKTKT
jgi:hypothetical protein